MNSEESVAQSKIQEGTPLADTNVAAANAAANSAETIYDVVVLGGGPAGYTAAIRAGEFKLKTAIVDAGVDADAKLGGTCLHVGCIPTKALLFSAEIWDHLKNAAELGIDNVTEPKVNWENLLKRKNAIITRHVKGLEFLMKKNKVEVIQSWGRLTGPAVDGLHTVALENSAGEKRELKTKNILLATGSDARMLPGLQADDRILTNVEILSIPAIPKSLVVIGAGAVGVEFASIFRSFGSEVSIIEYAPKLVPVEDEEISKELARQFKKRTIDLNVGAKVESIEKTETGVKVSFTDQNGKPQVKEAEKVLVAVGRAPRTAGIDIEKTKIELERGFVKVNEAQQTAEPGIYAAGDIVAGFPLLAHSGSMAGMIAIAKIAGKNFRPMKRERIPACTYTEPQIGTVGITEKQAREQGLDIKIGKFPFAGNSKATIVDSHDGFVKIVADAKYGEILGVHIIGPSATEMISEAVVAMDSEATIDELMYTVHAHPTLSEAMLDAYGAVEGLAINA